MDEENLLINKEGSQIDKLAEALANTQSEIQDAEKNSQNPHFKSFYADLSSVLQSIREPLAKNNLSLSQIVNSQGEDYFLETILLHKSGQVLKSKMKLILEKKTMQGLGVAITYARRYAAAAIVGISQEDSDGETQQEPKEFKPQQKPFNSPNQPANISDYVYPFGKLKGKKFSEIARQDLYSAHRWLCDTDKDKFKDLISKVEEFLSIPTEQMPPPPQYDPNEEIPF